MDAQEQHDQEMARRGPPRKTDLEALMALLGEGGSSSSGTSNPAQGDGIIDRMMAMHPGLTAEAIERMVAAHGF